MFERKNAEEFCAHLYQRKNCPENVDWQMHDGAKGEIAALIGHPPNGNVDAILNHAIKYALRKENDMKGSGYAIRGYDQDNNAYGFRSDNKGLYLVVSLPGKSVEVPLKIQDGKLEVAQQIDKELEERVERTLPSVKINLINRLGSYVEDLKDAIYHGSGTSVVMTMRGMRAGVITKDAANRKHHTGTLDGKDVTSQLLQYTPNGNTFDVRIGNEPWIVEIEKNGVTFNTHAKFAGIETPHHTELEVENVIHQDNRHHQKTLEATHTLASEYEATLLHAGIHPANRYLEHVQAGIERLQVAEHSQSLSR